MIFSIDVRVMSSGSVIFDNIVTDSFASNFLVNIIRFGQRHGERGCQCAFAMTGVTKDASADVLLGFLRIFTRHLYELRDNRRVKLDASVDKGFQGTYWLRDSRGLPILGHIRSDLFFRNSHMSPSRQR